MKIGFSLGRCIRDIVMGKISEDEVAFVITSTCIREIDQLAPVIIDYMSRDDYLNVSKASLSMLSVICSINL